MKTMKLSELVLDFDLYPRGEVDSQTCYYLRQAMAAGDELPPLVACQKTKRIVDGFHRYKAYEHLYGVEHKVSVVLKQYKTDAELFLDAIRYNARHGLKLTTFDRVHCISRARRLNIKPDDLAPALGVTKEKLEGLEKKRFAGVQAQPQKGVKGSKVGAPVAQDEPLKRTILHMSGKILTPEQRTANDKLSGMNQQFYVNQVIILIENDLLDVNDAKLMERIDRLRELLEGVVTPA